MSVGRMTFPIYGKIKMSQTTNQYIFPYGFFLNKSVTFDPQPAGSTASHALCTFLVSSEKT
jgi:hypothetical protein